MRSVLITGTSTGIGQATAVTLAARGWRVFATMRNLKKRGLLEQALKEGGVQSDVEIEQLDVTERHHFDPISRRIHAIANRQQA